MENWFDRIWPIDADFLTTQEIYKFQSAWLLVNQFILIGFWFIQLFKVRSDFILSFEGGLVYPILSGMTGDPLNTATITTEFIKSKILKNKNFAEKLQAYKVPGWEPESPESTLPSFLAVKRSKNLHRKDSLWLIIYDTILFYDNES